jgi:hypothetical protein
MLHRMEMEIDNWHLELLSIANESCWVEICDATQAVAHSRRHYQI